MSQTEQKLEALEQEAVEASANPIKRMVRRKMLLKATSTLLQ